MLLALWLITLLAACAPLATAPEEPPATFTRAENAFQRGEFTRAVEAYRSFLDHPTDEEYVPRAWYKTALSQYRLQQYRGALATLDELAARYPKTEWVQAEALRGDAHLALGNAVTALQSWAEAWPLASEVDRAALRRRFDRVVETLGETERQRALEVLTDPEIRTWLERPPAPAAAPQPTGAGIAPASTPAKLTARAETPTLPGARIGCLLPLSGRYHAFGERSVQGLRLAIGSDRDRLVIKDTRSDPEAARAAFTELAARADVVAVVGPLRSGTAAIVAPLAERAQVSLLLLAQREGLGGRYVVQTVMTRTQQAAALATQALQRHWRHIGMLAPNDNYGRNFAETFRAALESRGGRASWSGSYDPQTREVAAEIAHARELHTHGALDAVFVPDTAVAAATIGAAIRAAMPGIGLLGSNDWNDPAVLTSAGSSLDGALIVTGFFADSARPATRSFVDTFRHAHQAVPDIFAAQGYDAGVLLREALQHGGSTREAMIAALRHLDPVTGATGPLHVTDAGVVRELYVLRLGGGQLEEMANGASD